MDFIVENKSEVIKKMSFFDMVPWTLMRDLLVATARVERNVGGADVNVDSQYDSLRGLMRKVLVFTSQEKCSSPLSKRNQQSSHNERVCRQ